MPLSSRRNSILTYSLINVLEFAANVPSDQGWIVLVTAIQFVPAFTVAPRLVLSLRELYARDSRGRRGGDIDTAFGMTSVSGQSAAVTTMMFAGAGQNEVEEIQMEARAIGSASSDA